MFTAVATPLEYLEGTAKQPRVGLRVELHEGEHMRPSPVVLSASPLVPTDPVFAMAHELVKRVDAVAVPARQVELVLLWRRNRQYVVQKDIHRIRLMTKLNGGQAAKRVDRRLKRLASLLLFAPDASVRGVRPCAQTHSPTLSEPYTYAACRYHAWRRTPAHALSFLRRLDHYASSSPISSSGEHSTGQTRPKLETALTTIVRVLALLICLKFQVIR